MHGGRDRGFGRIAIGINERAIVFGMLGHEVDEELETGAAATSDLDVLRRLDQGLHFAQLCVELHDINLLYTVLEEAVDGGVEVLEIVLRDACTAIHTDNHSCQQLIARNTVHSADILSAHGLYIIASNQKFCLVTIDINCYRPSSTTSAENQFFNRKVRLNAVDIQIRIVEQFYQRDLTI